MNKFKEKFIAMLYQGIRRNSARLQVASLEQTMKIILNDRKSVSRFGDGELKWMLGIDQDSFQDNDRELGKQLEKVIKINSSSLLVCIPEIFNGMNQFTPETRFFWEKHYIRYSRKWINLLQINRMYYNANITRPYMEYQEKKRSEYIFKLWKAIFKDRNIIIAEGKFTRFGVGNDFLQDAKTVQRIVCPNKNAFKQIEKIESTIIQVVNLTESPLVLVALGPTASILAAKLSVKNIQTIDIGHADIEYEWFLKKANKKISVKNKFVNEAGDNLKDFKEINNSTYNNEIIREID